MSLQIYLNGRFVPEHEARVSVFDHGFLYGDGIFEGIRAYHGRVFKLKEHLDRLFNCAKVIDLNIGASKVEVENIVLETLRRNNFTDAYIRLVVSRGKGDLGLDPRNCPKASIICIADKLTLFPETLYQNGMEIKTVATRRNNVDSLSPRIKSLNYLNNIMARIEVTLAGAMEAVMLNNEGHVCEGTGDNIFIVKDGTIITPPTHVGILEGITRNTVMELGESVGIPVKEQLFTRFDLYTADEVFLTGTAAEMIPVSKVDGRIIGEGKPGEVFNRILPMFRELTKVNGPEIQPATEILQEALA
ncbi:MAG TPA: branched-chain-amino-acid transaminase [Candidatus Deferrimicrobium sp.]|nr:branched-chain-amino-acid transaminase [Candidatus Deferrimicrobium sp.]